MGNVLNVLEALRVVNQVRVGQKVRESNVNLFFFFKQVSLKKGGFMQQEGLFYFILSKF